MPNLSNICKICKTDESKSWWKCCPKHTSEKGVDVVCEDCANKCMSGGADKTISLKTICMFYCIVCYSGDDVHNTVFGHVCQSCIDKFETWLKNSKKVKDLD